MNRNAPFLLIGIAIVLGACSMASKYSRPVAPIPSEWPSGEAYTEMGAGASAASELAWRDFFTDEHLQKLVETALTNNRDLRLAALNVDLSRALYGIKRDELLPTVNATASASKQKASADLTEPGSPQTTEQYSANLGILSWEIDFFGRIRSLQDKALEEYLATEQARRSAQSLLISSVANAYLTLAADRENLALTKRILQDQKAAYDLVKRQYDVGVATELDLRQAQIPVETVRGDIARYMQLVAQDENALNLLLGTPAPQDLLPENLSLINPLKEVFPELPSDVLLRRPDVLQAENTLKAANADIGVARAAFFPRISLTTTLGTASNNLSGLFQSGTETWSYAPQLVMPIFDARTWSALKASKVQQELAVTQYERAIQNSFREVADALAVRGTIDQQVSAQQALVDALTKTYQLSLARYEKGIDNYLSVLDSQRSLATAQQGLVSLRLAKLVSQVKLYAALGGGAEPEESSPTQEPKQEDPTPTKSGTPQTTKRGM